MDQSAPATSVPVSIKSHAKVSPATSHAKASRATSRATSRAKVSRATSHASTVVPEVISDEGETKVHQQPEEDIKIFLSSDDDDYFDY